MTYFIILLIVYWISLLNIDLGNGFFHLSFISLHIFIIDSLILLFIIYYINSFIIHYLLH